MSPYRAVVFTDKDAPVSAVIREDFLMSCDDCHRTRGCHASGLVHEPVRPAMVNRRCVRTGEKLEELKLSLSRDCELMKLGCKCLCGLICYSKDYKA